MICGGPFTCVAHAVQFRDIVVSVARKTDAAMWRALFAAVGPPSELLEGLVDSGALATAACCLLIVDRIEGAPTAHASALRLIRVRPLGRRMHAFPLPAWHRSLLAPAS